MPDRRADRASPETSNTGTESGTGGVCLVVGDWFVDEHWVCGVHRSSASSRTGRSHLRALHSATSTVRAVCGAGRSAQFLHHLYRRSDGKEPLISLIGLGFWHRADTNALTSLFDPQSPAQTPYRLTPSEFELPRGIELINMNDALNFNHKGRTDEAHVRFRDEREYTTRIIRIYTHGERDQVQYDRLDWERRAPARVPWDPQTLDELTCLLLNRLQGRSVRAVIIKDLQKGVVNDSIIEWLVSLKLGPVPWFVSSKKWLPTWLNGLGNKVDLRLVMIPQVAAQAAIRDKDQKLSRWITLSGRPSKEAIDLIDRFATFTHAKNIFVLPEGFSALACECGEGSVTQCVVQSNTKPETITVDMGHDSTLFPALVASMSCDQTSHIDEPLMNLALRAAY